MGKAMHDMSLLELHIAMEEAINNNADQIIINLIALELTYRYYVPFEGKTFEEMLVGYGYRKIEKNKGLTKVKKEKNDSTGSIRKGQDS